LYNPLHADACIGGIIRDEPVSAKGRSSPGPRDYRVILKLDGDEFEIGSIGVQFGAAWAWGIDTVIPMRAHEAQGEGGDRRDS
jgi:hypothetical protein